MVLAGNNITAPVENGAWPASRIGGQRQPAAAAFDYDQAFSRNLGWVTREEQAVLTGKRVAIVGMGGVGGAHLLTLSRLGVGRFRIADYDRFELANFNRQVGATVSHLGQSKVAVMAGMAWDINPGLEIEQVDRAIEPEQAEGFLNGADLYVDSIDFFALDARRALFAACDKLNIPAITAAPLGMSAAFLAFMPGKMSFEEYFQLEGHERNEQLLRFMVGLAPRASHGRYLVDPSAIDLANQRGPSTPMGADMCAAVAGSYALKILLGRGPVVAAPHGLQFDAYRNKLVHTWRPGGNRHPLNRLVLAIGRRRFLTGSETSRDRKGAVGDSSCADSESSAGPLPYGRGSLSNAPSLPDTPAVRVLELARWAPSGDNTQPWRFELIDDRRFVVHGYDTREDCVYDLDGHSSQIALGALIQTIHVAASGEQVVAKVTRREGLPDTTPTFEVTLEDAPDRQPSALLDAITRRCTQRRPLSMSPLSVHEKTVLEQAAGDQYEIIWLDTAAQRRRMAIALFRSAYIRLTTRKAYEVHRRVIDWHKKTSEDRIPDQAVGLDPVALMAMRWAMGSWRRVRWMNRYLAGTILPRVQLDLVPAMRCGAHFVLVAREPVKTVDDYVAAGRAVQRFWLTATKEDLRVQPEMTPVIFGRYVRAGMTFTTSDKATRRAVEITRRLESLVGEQAWGRAVFMGRIGRGPAAVSRSVRKPLSDLM